MWWNDGVMMRDGEPRRGSVIRTEHAMGTRDGHGAVTTEPEGEGGSNGEDERECGCEGERMCHGKDGGARAARRRGKTECQKTTKIK
jgi:hypothetical protein